ncbi:tagatose 1,6-diphosphate aldolase [Devosia enhydra]|uniref:Tagatose 1,6-diphosphate aldolase n=1 Tax=Devosia enhydra TaxID=665118 RepID=A0A1K2HY33_9HYPH|nr:tagatose 1,6-diphosphate aldolase [Devosia enhydra]SFZ84673.1 tagatose 1,6-diphosphate aldolase [Devosia enhydra]
MNITPGKLWGLRRLADDAGRFKMLAMDQTGPIVNPIKAARGLDHAPYADVASVKRLLGKHLSAKASAVLIDPPLGYAAAIDGLSPRGGLLVATEWATWEVTETGRRSRNIPGWDPAVIRRIGGDAVKVNLWYRRDASPEVRAHQIAYVESVKAACAQNDIAFVLEFLVYPFPGETADAFAARRADLALEALSDPDVMDPEGVELYKLEPPVDVADVPDPDGPDAAAVQARFDRLARGIGRPWVLLSGGAAPDDFLRLLTYAYRSGASGYLAGRAIWAEAFRRFPDLAAMEAELAASAPRIMDRLNALTDRLAHPWPTHPAWDDGVVMVPSGEEFAPAYGRLAAAGVARP